MLVAAPLLFALFVGMVFAPLEALQPLRASTRRSWTTDVGFATVGGVLAHVLLTGLALGLSALAGGPLGNLPTWVSLPVGLVLFETMGYLAHRFVHATPTLARFHDVHHSSEDLDWLASFRQHPLEIAGMALVQNLPLVLLGLPVAAHGAVVVLLRVHAVFVHANLFAPVWMAPFVGTPRFHHRHHARDRTPANYAAVFPWLDRVFGTYAGDSSSSFGLPTPLGTGFVRLLITPFTRRDAER